MIKPSWRLTNLLPGHKLTCYNCYYQCRGLGHLADNGACAASRISRTRRCCGGRLGSFTVFASSTPPSPYWGLMAPVSVDIIELFVTPASSSPSTAEALLQQAWVMKQRHVRPLRPRNRSEAPKGEQWAVSCSNKPPPRSCREGWSPHFKFPGIRGGSYRKFSKDDILEICSTQRQAKCWLDSTHEHAQNTASWAS